jgi:hypothetical protein
MSCMSDMTPRYLEGDARLSVRVPHQLASRIDGLAAYCGLGRSAFIRTAILFAEAQMTLASLRRLESAGRMHPDQQAELSRAKRRYAGAERELRQKSLSS